MVKFCINTNTKQITICITLMKHKLVLLNILQRFDVHGHNLNLCEIF